MKKVAPTVSVLMPAYNAEKYLHKSVLSILQQTYKDFELLILDDDSTDATYSFAKKLAKKDRRIKVYKNIKNLNIAESRNVLLGRAIGKYIAWQDADDIAQPNRLAKQVKYLDTHNDVGIVGGYLNFFDDAGLQSVRKYAEHDDILRKNIFRYSPVAQPTAMIRKEALDYAGDYGLNLSPAEDIDMSFRIGTRYKFANLQQVTLKYRNYVNSSTYKRLRKIELVTIKTRCKYIFDRNYNFSLLDLVYNVGQFASIWLIPVSWKIKLFNYFRNS